MCYTGDMNNDGNAINGSADQKTSNMVSRWDLLNPETDARWHAKQAKEIEYDFAGRLSALKGEHASMGIKEFEKWEDALAEEYNAAKDKAYEGYSGAEDYYDVMADTVAYPGKGREPELRQTIEAMAGRFFPARRRALLNAISASSKTKEEKEADEKSISKFVEDAFIHMNWKNASREKLASIGYKEADSLRTLSHNNVIKDLNSLNDLAKSYNLRPFMMRDLLPSDAIPRREQTQSEGTIMRYDRDIVEEFYAYAFPSLYDEEEQKMKTYEKYGIYE